MEPVLELSVSPLGRVGEIEQTTTFPPELLGVFAVMLWPFEYMATGVV